MATKLIGALEPFDPSKMQWTSYTERMQEYLLANGVEDDRKKVAILLSTIGEVAYELLSDLYAPEKPNTKTFEQLVDKLKEHWQPKPTVISERYRFHQRSQQKGETVTDFVAALRRLAKHCQFGDFLNQALRDKLVCGLSSETIKKELLKVQNLTLADACSTATAMEAAEADSLLMDSSQKDSVNRIRGSKNPAERRKCYHCAVPGHSPDDCRYKTAKCYNCGKVGHTKRACKIKKRKGGRRQSQRQVEEDSETSEDDISGVYTQISEDISGLNKLQERNSNKQGEKAMIETVINKKKLVFEIDTGAAVTVLSQKELLKKE